LLIDCFAPLIDRLFVWLIDCCVDGLISRWTKRRRRGR
jgi:hypothetical protein